MANIQEKFSETINEYGMFEEGDTVLVAVSGGADSTALVNLLYSLRKELGISLHVAHLNHLLRKGDAELDAKYVENMAQRLSLPITVETIDVAALAERENIGTEEAARIARYDFFEKTAAKIGANKIAVGHNADDNVETFLMRLLRGAGIRGLCGIPPKRGKIVRPMIKIWRREIEDYVGALKLVPRRDYTNYESRYMRNSVRLKLIPQLKIYNLNIKEIILQTILLLTEDNLYLENRAAEAFQTMIIERDNGEIKLNSDKLKKLENTIRRYVLRMAIERVKGDLAQVAFNHIRQINEKIEASEKWEIHLPDGIFVYGEKGGVVVARQKPGQNLTPQFNYLLTIPGQVTIKEIGRILRGSLTTNIEISDERKAAYIDYNALGKEISVRNKRPGDRFCPLGVKGSKKLQDFFIDEKIPAEDRDKIPLVESGGRIIWVAGQRIDERVKVTEKTKKIVKLELL